MISAIEPVCCGMEHVPVNSAMLEIIASAFPAEPVTVYAEREHLAALRGNVSAELAQSLDWRDIVPPPRRGSLTARLRAEVPLLQSVATGAPGGKPDLVVLLAAAASTIFSVKWLKITRQLDAPVHVILHSAAAELIGWRSRNPIRRVTDLRSALAAPIADGIHYVLLEESLLPGIRNALPRLSKAFGAISHPLVPSEVSDFRRDIAELPLEIGFLGLATRAKGFDVFIEIAAEFERRLPGFARFHAIGSSPVGSTVENHACLSTNPGRSKLPRDEFLRCLRQLHYVCLPYQGQHYDLTASGVLIDALANAKPVVAFRTPTTAALFRNASPGILCDSKEQMIEFFLSRATGKDPSSYTAEVEAAKSLRTQRLPRNLVNSYLAATGTQCSNRVLGASR